MKKIFALIVVAAAMTVPAHAQFAFGAKAGLNLTEMTGDYKSAVKNKAGFFIGPTVKFTFPIVGLSVDGAALYDQRTSEVKGTDEKVKSQTIQVPINVRYGIGLGSVLNIFAFAGPQFGFNLGDKTTNIKETTSTIKGWKLKSSNLSANVGVGATILKHLQATVNYNFALGKTGEFAVDKTIAGTATDIVKGKMKANSWQVAVAYYF